MTSRPVSFAEAGGGRRLAVAGDVHRCIVSGEQTNGAYALIESTVHPGAGPPLHVHTREEEGFLLLEGELTFYAEDRVIRARAGDFINLPPGVRHRFQNDSNAMARMLVVVSPSGLEKMFEEIGVVLNANEPPPPVTHEDIERIARITPKYGITLFPPAAG